MACPLPRTGSQDFRHRQADAEGWSVHPLLALIPIVALVVVMSVRVPRLAMPMPAAIALPGAAVAALALQALAGRDASVTMLTARIIEGVLTSLMPLSIVFGAVLLFRTLKASGATDAITAYLERSTPDPVMRVVLIGWSFSYLVEGLSGFGTPAALAAPLLVAMGFPAIRAAAACLVMNTVPVVFGAVGMPVWFGLGELGLSDGGFRSIRLHAALMQCVIAPVVVALALGMLFPWPVLRRRVIPIVCVVTLTVGTSALVAWFSSEFPSIVGGAVGLGAALVAGRFMRGTGSVASPSIDATRLPIWRAAFPLVATVLLLAITRIKPLGLRELLNAEGPAIGLDAGSFGVLSISAALVVGFDNILGTGLAWRMPVLYVPFVIPFVLVSLISIPLLKVSRRQVAEVWAGAARSLALPAVALAGALVFVKLMMHGEDAAPVVTIGRALADVTGAVHAPLWLAGAPVVGALGSFFSGSATVSNLTFGPVQGEIAAGLGLDQSRVLALQMIGAAVGNMVCVHNIVAVAAVLGLTRGVPRDDPNEPVMGDARRPAEDPVAAILGLNRIPLLAAIAMTGLAAGVLSFV